MRAYVWRQKDGNFQKDCVMPRVKHGGGSQMVWRCFGGQSSGDPIPVEGRMTKKGYLHILQPFRHEGVGS